MGTISTLGRAAWRLFVTDGIPSSGANNPSKIDIIAFVDAVDAAISGSGGFTKITAGTTTDLGNALYDGTSELSINKASGAAHAVTLPAPNASAPGRRIQITDGKGDAEANPITITGNINGTPANTTVINTAYGWTWLRDNGTTWNIVG